MTKTINELLKEWNDPPFTRESFDREKAALILLFDRHYGVKAHQIDDAIKSHQLDCANKMVEWWINLHELERYL